MVWPIGSDNLPEGALLTSPLRSVNVDHVNRLMEAVRIGDELDMEKFLRVASDMAREYQRNEESG